ncbi:hypothetical protein A2U01_0106325, partial [Trifolium medium]|nr:hypothetical protein [Trifolium medium]
MPISCRLLFLDGTGLAVFGPRILFSLDEPLKVSVPNQHFNDILQMDALFGH